MDARVDILIKAYFPDRKRKVFTESETSIILDDTNESDAEKEYKCAIEEYINKARDFTPDEIKVIEDENEYGTQEYVNGDLRRDTYVRLMRWYDDEE